MASEPKSKTSVEYQKGRHREYSVHTHLIRCSATGEEVAVVVAMNRDVKDIGVIVEGLLGAIAVMNILRGDSTGDMNTNVSSFKKQEENKSDSSQKRKKAALPFMTSHHRDAVSQETHPVHDEDPVDVESLLQQFGCDGHRVEVAETPETAADRGRELLFVMNFIFAKAPFSCFYGTI